MDDSDEYMGTVSLKHITAYEAEFAIAVRKSAMGKGYSQYGMEEVIRYGFDDLGLESVYWCVSPENKRALRFYAKNGYQRAELPEKCPGGYSPEQIRHYIWYKAERQRHKEEIYN